MKVHDNVTDGKNYSIAGEPQGVSFGDGGSDGSVDRGTGEGSPAHGGSPSERGSDGSVDRGTGEGSLAHGGSPSERGSDGSVERGGEGGDIRAGREISIGIADLVPYIMRVGEKIDKMRRLSRVKYGARYNEKNAVEEMYRRFGKPTDGVSAEMFAKEYLLIMNKLSSLPSSVRGLVRDIGQAAVNNLVIDRLKKGGVSPQGS